MFGHCFAMSESMEAILEKLGNTPGLELARFKVDKITATAMVFILSGSSFD